MIYKGVSEIFYAGRKFSTPAMEKMKKQSSAGLPQISQGRAGKKKGKSRFHNSSVAGSRAERVWPWHKVATPGA